MNEVSSSNPASDAKKIGSWRRGIYWRLGLLLIIGLIIWPFYKILPSHQHDKRNLWFLRAETLRYLGEGSTVIEGLEGPVIFKEEEVISQTCDCPFMWHTAPPSGDEIMYLRSRLEEGEEPPEGFVERFYIAASEADYFGGRWLLFNSGKTEYVQDSQIDWQTQTLRK